MACGAFVNAISAHLFKKSKTLAIISGYPSSIYPYDRTEVSKVRTTPWDENSASRPYVQTRRNGTTHTRTPNPASARGVLA